MRHVDILQGTAAILLLAATPVAAQDSNPYESARDGLEGPLEATIARAEGAGTIGVPTVTSTGLLVGVLAESGSFDRDLVRANLTAFLPQGSPIPWSGGVYGKLVEIDATGVLLSERDLFVNGTWSLVSRSVGELEADILISPRFGSTEFVGRLDGKFAIPAGVLAELPPDDAFATASGDKVAPRVFPYEDARPDRKRVGFPYEDARPDRAVEQPGADELLVTSQIWLSLALVR